MTGAVLALLRRLASWLVRGPDAPYVRGDLEEAWERDLGRGIPQRRALLRYGWNLAASAIAMGRARLRVPRTGASWLDLKLGLRMLRKQPALTVVAVFALSIAIPVSLLPFHVAQAFKVTLPFDEGERIVGLRNWDTEASNEQSRSLHDFHRWKQELKSYEAIGAARTDPYNVISEDGRAAPVRGSEVTASTFDIVRVAPILGRRLVEADEIAGAPDVVVISSDVWRSRLGGAPDVVGRTVRIGGVPHEVVGVMPEGFLFPFRDHLWLPLRADPLDYQPGQGPDLVVFGRLADGVTLAEANAEIAGAGSRTAKTSPSTHARLRAEVVPFVQVTMGGELDDDPGFYALQVLALILLAVACGNVGTLILARTSTRSAEIAVRTALGASRARIVSQLFVEALVLAVLGAGFGLLLGDVVARRIQALVASQLPFWFDLGVKPRTVAWALGAACLSAVLAGVVPALKATGRGVQRTLQRATAGASGIRFGGMSTGLIMTEVALAVVFLTMGAMLAPSVLQDRSEGMGIADEEVLASTLRIPRVDPTSDQAEEHERRFRVRVATTQQELLRRLAAEPGVRGVTMASSLPGQDHREVWVEVEGEDRPSGSQGHWLRSVLVDVDYFRSLRRPVLLGRDFDRADLVGESIAERPPVIVNTSFVDRVLQGRNPLGQRIRYIPRGGGEPSAWYEIVGVVGHLGINEINPARDEGVYHPVPPGELNPIRIGVHVGADPAAFTARLRALATEVDAGAMIQDPMPLDEAFSEVRAGTQWGTFFLALLSAIAILLSSAGLYAIMSFTVAGRTREIGIRAALGATPESILRTIARRALLQLSAGVAVGLVAGGVLVRLLEDDSAVQPFTPWTPLALAAGAMLLVGMLACLPPLRRGLRIRPVDAMKEA
ncbi:MAG: ABC transporter permease [Longimicrobiales bacterium]